VRQHVRRRPRQLRRWVVWPGGGRHPPRRRAYYPSTLPSSPH
jgi:hypothetical protein